MTTSGAQANEQFTANTVTKGTVFRGYFQALDRLGWTAAVRERASEKTRAIMDDPPLSSAWVSLAPMEELAVIVEGLHGPEGVRRAARESVYVGVLPVLRVIVEGFLRLFGTSPATLFARLPQMTANSVKGTEYLWQQLTPNSGVMTVAYPERSSVPMAMFHGAAGSLEIVFDLCKVKGTIAAPERSTEFPNNGAILKISW